MEGIQNRSIPSSLQLSYPELFLFSTSEFRILPLLLIWNLQSVSSQCWWAWVAPKPIPPRYEKKGGFKQGKDKEQLKTILHAEMRFAVALNYLKNTKIRTISINSYFTLSSVWDPHFGLRQCVVCFPFSEGCHSPRQVNKWTSFPR